MDQTLKGLVLEEVMLRVPARGLPRPSSSDRLSIGSLRSVPARYPMQEHDSNLIITATIRLT